jgi:hypothetical protein
VRACINDLEVNSINPGVKVKLDNATKDVDAVEGCCRRMLLTVSNDCGPIRVWHLKGKSRCA